MMMIKNKKILFLTVTIFIVVIGFYFIAPSNRSNTAMTQEGYVEGFEKGTTLKLSTLSQEDVKTHIKTVQHSEKTALPDLTLNQKTGIVLNVNDNKDNYDIVTIDDGKNIVLTYENLPLNSQVSLMRDGTKIHNHVPVDWVGNLVLNVNSKPSRLCNEIFHPSPNISRTICYTIHQEETS
jgi:hypothetical protein